MSSACKDRFLQVLERGVQAEYLILFHQLDESPILGATQGQLLTASKTHTQWLSKEMTTHFNCHYIVSTPQGSVSPWLPGEQQLKLAKPLAGFKYCSQHIRQLFLSLPNAL